MIKARNQTVTEALVRNAASSLKEAETNYISVLNDLFCPMSKKRVQDLGFGELEEAKYVDRLCRELEGCGALDRVALGNCVLFFVWKYASPFI